MRTSSKFIAVLMLCCLGITGRSFADLVGNSCSAGTFLGLGGSCEINCPANSHPVCSTGFLSTRCECVPNGGAGGGTLRNLPLLTPQQTALAQEFISWAQGGTPAIQQLGSLAQSSMITLQQHNAQAFSMSEDQFGQTWTSLAFPDQQLITNWRAQHGLGN